MNNMSDGKSDGLMFTYVKNGTIYPIAVKKKNLEVIDLMIPTMIGEVKVIADKPQGNLVQLKGGTNE